METGKPRMELVPWVELSPKPALLFLTSSLALLPNSSVLERAEC